MIFKKAKKFFLKQSKKSISHVRQEYNTKQYALFVPTLDDLAIGIKSSLENNYKNVQVCVQSCPDLTYLGIASSGICGKTCLVDVGGVPFLLDPEWQDVYFDLKKLLEVIERPLGNVIGAAAAWNGRIGVNGELMSSNCPITERNTTHFSLVDKQGSCHCAVYPWMEQGPLSNMFVSDGKNKDIIYVEVEVRTGDDNLITCIRKGLTEYFQCEGEKQLGIGGVFFLEKGKVRAHVMSDFASTCLIDGSPEVLNDWLKYYQVGPNLVFLTTMITGDPTGGDMHLRLEHTHFFSCKKPITGGHYHYDTTPAIVKYIGYFSPAETVFRIRDAWDEVKINLF